MGIIKVWIKAWSNAFISLSQRMPVLSGVSAFSMLLVFDQFVSPKKRFTILNQILQPSTNKVHLRTRKCNPEGNDWINYNLLTYCYFPGIWTMNILIYLLRIIVLIERYYLRHWFVMPQLLNSIYLKLSLIDIK